jgi:hypothetical protein
VYIANIIHLFTIAVAAVVAFVAFKLVQFLARITPSSGEKQIFMLGPRHVLDPTVSILSD